MRVFPIVFCAPLLVMSCSKPQHTRESANAVAVTAPGPASVRAQPAPVALDDFLVFEDPLGCGLTRPGYDFMRDLLDIAGDGSPIRIGTVSAPREHLKAFGQLRFELENDYALATLPVDAYWHGLRLTRVESGFWGMDSRFFDFTFDEPFERVRATLNNLGFTLDKKGIQHVPPLYEGFEVKLEVEGGKTILSCSR